MTDDDKFLADLHAIANRARTSDPEASTVPNSWQQVLATVNPTPETTIERRPSMHTHIAQPMHPVWEQSTPHNEQSRSFGGSIRRFTSLAATIALVLAVAVGGWLAMSQMPTGESNPRFAVLGTPEVADATCDVEPMTVDEVMEIVENPYRYASPEDYGASGYRSGAETPWEQEYADVQPTVSREMSPFIDGDVPTEAAMAEALPILNSFMACAEEGTVAHTLQFTDPFSIQKHVTDEFPFYRDQEEVRTFVEEWISGPSPFADYPADSDGRARSIRPNPNISEANTQYEWMGLGFGQILYIGSVISDADGEVLARYDSQLSLVQGEEQDRFVLFTMVYSHYTEEWYVVTSSWPYGPDI